MTLGGKIDDRPHARADHLADQLAVGDVAANEAITRMLGDVLEVPKVAGVGEQVEVDDPDVRFPVEQVADEVAADEAAAARDQYSVHGHPFPQCSGGIFCRTGYSARRRQVKVC